MQGGTEKSAGCLRDAIRRHCHAQLISPARLTVDLGALSCGGQARLSSVIGTLPISLARLISRARLTVDPGALYAVASGALLISLAPLTVAWEPYTAAGELDQPCRRT
jgi:hypothetical protein